MRLAAGIGEGPALGGDDIGAGLVHFGLDVVDRLLMAGRVDRARREAQQIGDAPHGALAVP
jgi:hypothetical protein